MKGTYIELLKKMAGRPGVYEASEYPFWDDEYISKNMLAAHLDESCDAASRRYEYIKRSVEWIGKKFLKNSADGKTELLDLGCGPGIYDELFCKAGFKVTGIDFSKRSIAYAKKSAEESGLAIEYYYQNYLTIDYENEFDVVTLIYCDFGVLSPEDRKVLLNKVKRALKPEGKLLLDGFTTRALADFKEGRTVQYKTEGFWSPVPHICIQNNYYYEDTHNYLEQYLIITEDDMRCYNTWNQIYSIASMTKELEDAGFSNIEFYDDVTGKSLTDTSTTLCAVATV